jgi:hypothetical protein
MEHTDIQQRLGPDYMPGGYMSSFDAYLSYDLRAKSIQDSV